jgi:hypothetical protein
LESGTRIEALEQGWCWWAVAGGRLWLQVVADPRTGPPSAWTAAAARQIPELARVLERASPAGEPGACAAHARLGAGAAASGLWRAGDTAAALDPLSGQGIYQALASARLTSTAVGSVADGGDLSLAQRFVDERHEAAFEQGVRIAAEFYRAHRERGAFWSQTAAAYESLLREPAQDQTERRIERRPVLTEGRIVEREVIVCAAHPRGVWHVSGVPVADLMRYLGATTGATVQSAAVSLGRPAQAVASAIHWLRQSSINPGG